MEMYKRLIATLLVKDGLLVQSVNFKNFYPIGKPQFTIDLISRWDIDEIFLLNISGNRSDMKFNNNLIKSFAKKCFVPLTIGGGVDSVSFAKKLISYGADKILINSSCIENPNIIYELSKVFGSQCIVVGIDVKKIKDKHYVFKNSGTIKTDLDINKWIQTIEELGAGEILINSIDRDGTKKGFDLSLLRKLDSKYKIPIIFQGGAGNYLNIYKALISRKLSGCAIGNMFHFTEHSTITAKAYLQKKGIGIRFDNPYNYKGKHIDQNGRVLPSKHEDLNKLTTKPSQKHLI
jgi:cyclase